MSQLNLLVLATDYTEPSGRVALHYIHSRNREYIKAGINVDVLSFAANHDYVLDGIPVYSTNSYKKTLMHKNYDIVVSHAPNLRNHVRFFMRYGANFEKIVFFFHGHEVLRTSAIYPRPYSFMKKNFLWHGSRDMYDLFKVRVLGVFFRNVMHKSEFVFVSEWMATQFYRFLDICPVDLEGKQHIIYNCVGQYFEENAYDPHSPKGYDFITIRNSLDHSKYAVDFVCEVAENNPALGFCLIGKGDFFEYYDKPANLDWIDRNLGHEEIVSYLNQSRCALLPTRADAQGVMACEMATFGIPLITSDIDVCREIFLGFDNVALIDNQDGDIDLRSLLTMLEGRKTMVQNERYFMKNTVHKEIELFRRLKG